MAELAFVFGTRSEAIRLAPLIRTCERHGVSCVTIHTGERNEAFGPAVFDLFGVDGPDITLDIGSGSHGEQTGMMLVEIERALAALSPSVVVVQGDTDSTLAGAVAASKMDSEVAYVGAGRRSFDREATEETNRVVADHVADYLFAATEKSRWYLVREGITEFRISVTGSTAVDAIDRVRDDTNREPTVLDDVGLPANGFVLVAAHTRESVDEPGRFGPLLEGAARAGSAHDLEAVCLIHPNDRERIAQADLDVPNGVRLVESQTYAGFIRLLSASAAVVTDSGSVQEEACILGVPCVTVRNKTDRAETIDCGANRLSRCDPDAVFRAVTESLEADAAWENPYGDGDAAERVFEALPVSVEQEGLVQ